MANGRLADKVAIVTGAGTGMGRAIACALAEEGARIVLAGRTRATLEETAEAVRRCGAEVVIQPTDVADPAQAEALAGVALARWGRVDVLVNNAGTNSKRRAYADATVDDWNQVVRTNLDGVYHCTRAVLPIMRAQGAGQVINIASMAGRRASVMSGVAYSASKHGVVALERWGRVDILVNNAGTNSKRRAYADATVDDWNQVVRTNLDGVYHCTRAVLPTMRAQGSGQVINIASMAGRRASVMSGVAYSASKHGVVALTQSLNEEEWRNGIRATCVEPGEVATPILDLRPDPPPMETRPHMVQPEDIGEAVRYLATLPQRVLIDEMTIRPTVRRVG